MIALEVCFLIIIISTMWCPESSFLSLTLGNVSGGDQRKESMKSTSQITKGDAEKEQEEDNQTLMDAAEEKAKVKVSVAGYDILIFLCN